MNGEAKSSKIAESVDDNLVAFIEALQKIDTKTPIARLNETTITDNNGGRIEL